ncbi:MAG: septal ring lytic transglycosylase RlpA family protein [Desulfopila sp.]
MALTPLTGKPAAPALLDKANHMEISRPLTTRNLLFFLIWAGLVALLAAGCASKTPSYGRNGKGTWSDPTQAPYVIKGVTYYPIPDATGFKQKGLASWYGDYFHGRPTSNGEKYNMYGMTAAHKILPMNTMVQVRNLDNGRKTVVRVNDRGPFVDGRIIDLSYTAASQLGVVGPGTSRVEIVAITENSGPTPAMRPENNRRQSPSMTPSVPAPSLVVAQPKAASTLPVRPATSPVTVAAGPTKIVKSPSPQAQAPELEFYVQVGKFREKRDAQRLQQRFASAGHTTIIEIDNSSPLPNYLVSVFAGTRLAAAKKAEEALLRRGYTGAAVMVR